METETCIWNRIIASNKIRPLNWLPDMFVIEISGKNDIPLVLSSGLFLQKQKSFVPNCLECFRKGLYLKKKQFSENSLIPKQQTVVSSHPVLVLN